MASAPSKHVFMDAPELLLAPYVWKRTGTGAMARAEAVMPGAYLKATFQGCDCAGLLIDASANAGCAANSMPVIEWSVDHGPFEVHPLEAGRERYTLPLASELDAGAKHEVEVYFRAANLGANRWRATTARLRIGGLELGAQGTLPAQIQRPKKAIGFGDSITEGVGVEGLFTSWEKLEVNNARVTWLPIVCAALGCEYGQLGTGGQGMSKTFEIPPLVQSWQQYDSSGTSRLTAGRLLPAPDYAFCCMGTNDFGCDITADYTRWLGDFRRACPTTLIFCVVPPLGLHEGEIASAVKERNDAGDGRVYLIDPKLLRAGFHLSHPTQLADDGVHPSQHGQALLGAFIAAEAQRRITMLGAAGG